MSFESLPEDPRGSARRRENRELRRRLSELERVHRQLSQQWERERAAVRTAAVEQTAVTLQHAINNSLAGMTVALRLVTRDADALRKEARGALRVIQREIEAISAVMAELRRCQHPAAVPYLDQVQMIRLPRRADAESDAVPCGSGGREP